MDYYKLGVGAKGRLGMGAGYYPTKTNIDNLSPCKHIKIGVLCHFAVIVLVAVTSHRDEGTIGSSVEFYNTEA